MKKFFFILFILFLSVILIVGALTYAARKAIVSTVETSLITYLEKVTSKNIDIGKIKYAFPHGVIFSDIAIFDHGSPRSTGIHIEEIFLKPSLLQSVFSRQLLFSVSIKQLIGDNKSLSGTITLRTSPIKSFKKPFEDIQLESVLLSNVSLGVNNFNMSAISGDLSVTDHSVYASDVRFFINAREHLASFSFVFNEELSLIITGPFLNSNINIQKTEDQYKIVDSSVKWAGSVINIDGVVSDVKDPYLSLGIRTNLNLKDLLSINSTLKHFVTLLNIDGEIHSMIAFDGPLKNSDYWKIYGEFSSSSVRIHNILFHDLNCKASFIDSMLVLPVLKANTYNGVTSMAFKANLKEEQYPFIFTVTGDDIQLNKAITDISQKPSRIVGDVFFNLEIQGYLANIKDVEGSGAIIINNANLGLMPIIAPLITDLHSFMTKTVKTLEDISITGAECNITIKNKKVSTNNLWFWGNILNIYAKGYIGFNKDIYFEVTNEIKEVSESQEDWQKDLVQFMATVGKVIGKAYLKGTLDNYKWEFDLFGGWQDTIALNIQKFINNMLEQ